MRLRQIYEIMMRELLILRQNHIYRFCMVAFPVLVIFFFTSLMDDGLPTEMPIGIVDLDNTSTTRSLGRRLDGFQMSRVVAHYPTMSDARKAIQRNEIYGFLYIPKGTTEKLLSQRQPKISYYYSYTTLAAGALLMKDMKTISTLGSAAVGQATMRARGLTDRQVQTALQSVISLPLTPRFAVSPSLKMSRKSCRFCRSGISENSRPCFIALSGHAPLRAKCVTSLPRP